ncbi:restriction endonuclease [Paenibacillus sp. Y412MC10]|uniref:restriction endonuclease n=1 Tax=Geobacillus sp. (strain Y412MC10) TaxID=481743 RepID=UPI0011A3CF1F|nr:restriction endonuclease [Paenibacillus sp. Y412MC10]
MALWLFRAGRSGEYESKFLNDQKVYLTWDQLNIDLKSFTERSQLVSYFMNDYEAEKLGRARNWAGQVWPIAHEMNKGDWIILPSKIKSAIHIGKITGDYEYDISRGNPYYHSRDVEWFATDIPRTNFDQDLLYSFGAFMTVCRISRNDAERRIKAMAANHWFTSIGNANIDPTESAENEEENLFDLEEYANDAIAKYIIQKFKGHGMARIIEAILKAKGFTTYISPEGPDKGVDILAAPGNLGFGEPKICVQVKTSDTPVDRPTLDQLIGTMHNFKASHGLLVSWSGFKSSVDKEIASQFFNVRLWDQKAIIHELLENYDTLEADIKAEIPLKRAWILAGTE